MFIRQVISSGYEFLSQPMMQRWDLQGKVAIITEGNGGIGLGMAKGLSAAGATLVIAARNEDKSAAAVESIVAGNFLVD